jgi:hypothetical protein
LETRKCTGGCDEVKEWNTSIFISKYGKPSQPCRECQRRKIRQHYCDNRQYYIDKATIRTTGLREWLKDIKSELKCQKCGEDHPACIEFHHRDPSKKDMDLATVAGRGICKERILKEIEKCDILCSNCHRKYHFDTKTGPWARRN